MDALREKIINELLDRINHYDTLSREIINIYTYTEKMPDGVKRRFDAIGNVTDGLHEAIQIIYAGGKKNE